MRALVDQRGGDVGLELRGADGEEVQREGEGAEGVARLQDRGQGGDDHDDVGDAADGDALADHPEAAVLGVGEPAEEDGQAVGEELEGLGDGRGDGGAAAQGAGGEVAARVDGAGAGAVGRQGEGRADEVLVDLVAAVVRGALGELDGAQPVGGRGHLAGDAAQRGLLLLIGKHEALPDLVALLVVGHRLFSGVRAVDAGLGQALLIRERGTDGRHGGGHGRDGGLRV